MTADILDPSAILDLLPSLLPQAKLLASPEDAIAALVHSALTTLAFRLVAIDQVATSSASQSKSNVLPVEWNKNGPSYYSFKYRHEQSSLDFLISVSKLGTRTLVNAIALEVCRLEVFMIVY
jgi:proteasome inhibitor subunit 1 (PI31)